jgi:glycosyltransferase involved in cell wall biosynthesis
MYSSDWYSRSDVLIRRVLTLNVLILQGSAAKRASLSDVHVRQVLLYNMSTMKIGLNGQKLLIENPAGPEKYTFNLYRALAEIDNENNYVIYFNSQPSKEYFKELTSSNQNFSYKVISYPLLWTQLGLAIELLQNPVDVFFTPVHTLPMLRNKETNFVTMIHGLEHKYTAGYKNPLLNLKIERPVKYTVKHSDKLVVPTTATKDEIIKRNWGQKAEIEIINEGVAKRFYKRTAEEIEKLKEKYELGSDPYLLFVSTIQPRKNIPGMVEGFSKALSENQIPQNIKLLISGKKGWDYEESLEAPRKFGVENSVKFLGRVPDEDMPALFSGASAFINVSFEEGFGLPILEAMACEVPCVVSDIPPYREVGGKFPIYVDPRNVESIKEGIVKILSQPVNAEIINGAKQRASEFTWEKTAQKILAIFQSVVKNS